MHKRPGIILILISALVLGQTAQSSIETEKGWRDFTQTQKNELVGLSAHLYDQEQYDQAILSLFQFLYRYPGDSIEPLIYYFVGRCYEESSQPELAIEYYRKILESSSVDSSLINIATYRTGISLIILNRDNEVREMVRESTDPYLMTLRGLVEFRAMNWEEARLSFQAAEARFNDTYYSVLLRRMMDHIDMAVSLSGKKKWITILSSIAPGGGWVYLGDYTSAMGTMMGVAIPVMLAFKAEDISSENVSYEFSYGSVVPGIGSYKETSDLQSTVKTAGISHIHFELLGLGVAVYTGSILASYNNVNETNKLSVLEYINSNITLEWLEEIFLNTEPELSLF